MDIKGKKLKKEIIFLIKNLRKNFFVDNKQMREVLKVVKGEYTKLFLKSYRNPELILNRIQTYSSHFLSFSFHILIHNFTKKTIALKNATFKLQLLSVETKLIQCTNERKQKEKFYPFEERGQKEDQKGFSHDRWTHV